MLRLPFPPIGVYIVIWQVSVGYEPSQSGIVLSSREHSICTNMVLNGVQSRDLGLGCKLSLFNQQFVHKEMSLDLIMCTEGTSDGFKVMKDLLLEVFVLKRGTAYVF